MFSISMGWFYVATLHSPKLTELHTSNVRDLPHTNQQRLKEVSLLGYALAVTCPSVPPNAAPHGFGEHSRGRRWGARGEREARQGARGRSGPPGSPSLRSSVRRCTHRVSHSVGLDPSCRRVGRPLKRPNCVCRSCRWKSDARAYSEGRLQGQWQVSRQAPRASWDQHQNLVAGTLGVGAECT